MPIRLALSVHAADDALRSQLMPVNDRYPLEDVLAACRAYHARRRRQVFVEYVMLAGVNDRYEQAVALAERLDPRVFKVNLIPYNPTGAYAGSSREADRRLPRGADVRRAHAPPSASPAGATSTPPAGSWLPPRPAIYPPSRPTRGRVRSHGLRTRQRRRPALSAGPKASARDSPPAGDGAGRGAGHHPADRRHHRRGPDAHDRRDPGHPDGRRADDARPGRPAGREGSASAPTRWSIASSSPS